MLKKAISIILALPEEAGKNQEGSAGFQVPRACLQGTANT
jgi:hypothetical protein